VGLGGMCPSVSTLVDTNVKGARTLANNELNITVSYMYCNSPT